MNWTELYEGPLKNFYIWGGPLILIIILIVASKLLSWLLIFFEKQDENSWRSPVIKSVKTPLILLIWFMTIIAIINHYIPLQNEYAIFYKIISPTQKIAFILILGWFLLSLINNIQSHYISLSESKSADIDRTAVDAIKKILTIIVFFMVALGIIQALGISISGLLAFGGAAGIAVGFAAQNLVSNLFGGLTVFASKIFKIGDDIIIKDADLSGKVIHIGWRSTTIESWDGKRVYIPNSLFNTHNLINNSRLTHRTLSQDILISYRDYKKIQDVVNEGNKWLSSREDLSYFVFHFSEFGESALKLNLYAWIQSIPSGGFVPYSVFAKAQEEILIGLADIAYKKGCNVLPINHVWINEYSK